jgi:nucleoside-diphosphate-sugar epimerase
VARILVTGAAGFIGTALCPALAARGHQVVAGIRAPLPSVDRDTLLLGEIGPATDWSSRLDGTDIVIHLAQRAHRGNSPAALAGEPNAVAVLARAAAIVGVKRLVLVSSVKAMGEATVPDHPFRADDQPHPGDAYGRTKLASEQAARAATRGTETELVIIRPPLVYGPGVRANFRALTRLAGSGLPLPFAAIDNCRSLIFLENVVDLIAVAAIHPAAAGSILLARDGDDLSTPALICALAEGQNHRARLFPVPHGVLAVLRHLPGLGPAVSRLTLSLQVDDSPTRATLDWTPPVTAAAGLAATARAFTQNP